jgi:murein DD-endopeptidase MepM/ murein hydrolase activator NlpD
MKLNYPLISGYISQKFGANANSLYKSQGLKGHTAVDFQSTYNDTILPAIEAPVYSLMNENNPDPMKYRAVFQIYDDIDFSYEISYGHCNKISCKEGQIPQVIGTEGNTGDCYVEGRLVTKEEKLQGSTQGFHLHFQVRKCKRVPKRGSGHYLRNSGGFYRKDGLFYEIVDYDNGYNGCVDPLQFLPSYWFNYDFYFDGGATHQDPVIKMQEVLIKLGYLEPIPQDEYGYFGIKTSKALKLFQNERVKLSTWEKLFISGSKVGPRTRRELTLLT